MDIATKKETLDMMYARVDKRLKLIEDGMRTAKVMTQEGEERVARSRVAMQRYLAVAKDLAAEGFEPRDIVFPAVTMFGFFNHDVQQAEEAASNGSMEQLIRKIKESGGQLGVTDLSN